MGEKIDIVGVEMIFYDDRALIQIDLFYPEQNRGDRTFIELDKFFKMLSKHE